MKLINYLILRISLVFTIIMLTWSALYLVPQRNEINTRKDNYLLSLREQFISRANSMKGFVENYDAKSSPRVIVTEIPGCEALRTIEHFSISDAYFLDSHNDSQEVRVLTSAFYCEQNGKYYKLQFFTPTIRADLLFRHLLYFTLALWLVQIVSIIIGSRIIIQKANQSFYRTLTELKRFRLDRSQNITLPATKIAEYTQLNEVINELVEKNTGIFTEQKEFIENCSHELQTPLAIAITRLELLLDKYQENEALAQELSELNSILHRMKRLNSSLLLLSKIKNDQFADLQQINLNEEIQHSLDKFAEFINYKELQVTFTGQTTVTKEMNGDLARILFMNLLKNAITHTDKGGTVDILLTSDQIIITNAGSKPISHHNGIFSRYKQVKPGTDSSGIGLSIVKSVADLYRIEISYQFSDQKHIFILQFS